MNQAPTVCVAFTAWEGVLLSPVVHVSFVVRSFPTWSWFALWVRCGGNVLELSHPCGGVVGTSRETDVCRY